MADLDSASSVAPDSSSVTAGDTSPAPAAPASDSSGASSGDTRSIAASLLSDTGAPPAAPHAPDSATPSEPPAAAISGEDDADYQNLLASGSIPVDRHKAVITNTRNKTRAEVERELKAQYAWADQMDRTRAEQALGLMQALDRNPEVVLRTLAGALGINFTPQPQAPAEPQGPPPPDVRLDDGSEFYSAKQLAELNKWQQQQFDQRLAQVTARFEPLIQRQVQADMQIRATAQAGDLLATCRKEWPQFGALEGDIKTRMVQNPQLSLEHAYIQAFAAKGLPALEQQYQTDRASQLSRKAAASAPPPGAPVAVTPLRDRDRASSDIAREELLRAGMV